MIALAYNYLKIDDFKNLRLKLQGEMITISDGITPFHSNSFKFNTKQLEVLIPSTLPSIKTQEKLAIQSSSAQVNSADPLNLSAIKHTDSQSTSYETLVDYFNQHDEFVLQNLANSESATNLVDTCDSSQNIVYDLL